jgi:hypothetical protein
MDETSKCGSVHAFRQAILHYPAVHRGPREELERLVVGKSPLVRCFTMFVDGILLHKAQRLDDGSWYHRDLLRWEDYLPATAHFLG